MSKRKTLSIFLFLTLTVATIFTLSGCKNNQSTQDAQAQEMIFGQTKSPQSPIEATRSSDVESSQIVGNILEGLLEKDVITGELITCLAEDMPTISEDGLEYTFKLKQGVKFHDGTKLTANDVKFSIERTMTPSIGSAYAENLNMILGAKEMLDGKVKTLFGVQILDEYTIKFTLESRFALFLNYIGTLCVLPEETCKNSNDWEISSLIGTGPFKLDKLNPETSCRLTKFEEYHGEKPKIDSILFKFYADTATLLLDYEANNVDVVFLSDTDAENYEKNTKFSSQLHSFSSYAHSFITLNFEKEPWNNIRVREAFSYAIDREEIANDLYGGRFIAAGCLSSPNLLSFDKNVPVKKYDPEKSKQILKGAGFEKPLKIDLYISNSTFMGGGKTAIAIKDQSKQAGFDINIIQTDTAAREAMFKKGAIDFAIIRWDLSSNEANGLLYNVFHSKNSPGFASNYKNKDYDNLVEEARKTLDKTKRTELFRKADAKLVSEDFAVIPIGYPKQYYMVKPRLKNFNANFCSWILPFRTCYI